MRNLGIIGTCVTLFLSGCMYTHPRTERTYMQSQEYEIFSIEEHPTVLPSEFVGFCVLPLQNPADPRGRATVDLVSNYMERHGYKRVTQEELRAHTPLVKRTFMLGVGYEESFSHNTLGLTLTLYYLDPVTLQNIPFYTAKTKFDGYPIKRETLQPVMRDLFDTTPMWDSKGETIFPRMSADASIVEQYMLDLAFARMKLQHTR